MTTFLTCRTCGKQKAFTNFYRYQGRPEHSCKLCKRAAVAENRLLKIDYYREYDRIRAQQPEQRARWMRYVHTPAGRESRRITQRIYRAAKRAAVGRDA